MKRNFVTRMLAGILCVLVLLSDNGMVYASGMQESGQEESKIDIQETVDQVLQDDTDVELQAEKEESLTLSESSLDLAQGEIFELKVGGISDADEGTVVTWLSSDESVATVADGMVNAVGEGDCFLTVSIGDKSVVCNVTVTANTDETAGEVMDMADNRIAGGTVDESYGHFVWEIDNNGVLTVEGSGDVTDNHTTSTNSSPWYAYREQIVSAKINMTGMKNAAYLFYGCKNMVSADLYNFDTSQITSMKWMFYGCQSLEKVDVSNFNTSRVTDMDCMFSGCSTLSSLDVSNFNTSQVVYMGHIFAGCSAVPSLDVSNFNTSKVTSMSGMFGGCSSLSLLDVSNFDTSQVIYMESMFSGCSSLTELNLSSFDTRKVEYMGGMFEGCTALPKVDVSNFDICSVKSLGAMFSHCSSMTEIDLSNFDTRKVETMQYMFTDCESIVELDLSNFETTLDIGPDMFCMFANCYKLTRLDLSNLDVSHATRMGNETFNLCNNLSYIKTPVNLQTGIALPIKNGDVWYQENGETIEFFPQNLNYSVTLTKNEIPSVQYPYITARKAKAHYECGEELNIDDLTVTWYEDAENITVIDSGYTTNASEIDMSTPGRKDLTVTYNGKSATIRITVAEVTKTPEETMYTVAFDLQGHGAGAPSAQTVKKGDKVAKPADPKADGYIFTGWYKEPACTNQWNFDTDIVEEALTLYAGWKEESIFPSEETFTVTFDLQGYGTDAPPVQTVEEGGKVIKPADPEVSDHIFTGWYKEPGCVNRWDFDVDMVDGNIILYAGWLKSEEEIGDVLPEDIPHSGIPRDELWAAKIPDALYTGKALKPDVHIYYGTERLETGRDYTLSYKNNVKAGLATINIKVKKYYMGTVPPVDFYIRPVNLKYVTADDITAAWNKKIQKKVPVPVWCGKKLTKNKDFKAEYNDGGEGSYQNPGVYNITLIPGSSGNFIGEKTVRLTITDSILMSKVSVKKGKGSLTYNNGMPVLPQLTLTYKKQPLHEGEDYKVTCYNNTHIGTATAVLTGIGKYAGTKKVTYKITGTSIKKAMVNGIISPLEYAGGTQTQGSLSVSLGGVPLRKGVDYTVVYSHNKNAGKAAVTIKGAGQYTGTIKKTFKITAYDLKKDEEKGFDRQLKGLEDDILVKLSEYTTGKAMPEPVLIFKGRKLIKNRDYSISYKNNKKEADKDSPKPPTIVIKGRGNFKGSIIKTFTIIN
ncbi:MAG TPA: hypothetical protein DD414_04595 [Lachnospiraceae bacterium]|nr:hypothetical protein [Lachnospiraceae bacterium]